MAYDASWPNEYVELLKRHPHLTEKQQFGGVGFLYRGNMAVGVLGGDVLVRVGPAQHEAAMKSAHARPFALTGRPSKGWVLIGPGGVKSAARLNKWVELGLAFARTLPAK